MAAGLAEHFALPAGSLVVRDGSGLSKKNRLAPAAAAKLLAVMAKSPNAEIFLASLPVSGIDGTMRKRLAKKPYRGRVQAKTGYIAGASCLSGYILDKQNTPAVAFSILINRVPPGKGYLAKRLQDTICKLLVDSLGD